LPNFQDCLKKIYSARELKKVKQDFEGLSDADLRKELELQFNDLEKRKKRAKLSAMRLAERTRHIEEYKGKPQEAVMTVLAKSSNDIDGNVSLEARIEAVQSEAHAKFYKQMEQYRSKNLGFSQDTKGPKDALRYLASHAIDDPDARALARAFKQLTDELKDRFNLAGGDIGTLPDWLMPQSHDPVQLVKAGREKWIEDIKPMVDLDRMGVAPEEADNFLSEVFDSITTNGANKETGMGQGMRANRHSKERILHFKDVDKWINYQDTYGTGDIFGSMMSHIDGLSRDIAMVEHLGPNPAAAYKHLRETAINKYHDNEVANAADNVFAVLNGETAAKNAKWAEGMATARNWVAGTKLGSATISALSDTVFQGITAAFNGVPVFRTGLRFMANLNPANIADRRLAARMGIGAQYALDSLQAANRFTEVTAGHKMSKRFASFTMKASGLEGWTEAGQRAFSLEFSAALGDNIGKSLDSLGRLGKALKRYGITEDEWKGLHQALEYDRGQKYLNPMMIADKELRAKVQGMIISERGYAVPEPTARVMAALRGNTQAGTVPGEVMRSITQFKSFPLTLWLTHLRRMTQSVDLSTGGKLAYTSSMLVGTTFLGAVAYQAKKVSKGETPVEVNDKLLVAGLVQGGGLGIFGDFLFSDQNRFGGSFTSTVAGPMAGDFEKIVAKLIVGNIQQAAQGKKTNFAREFASNALTYTPGQLWYTQLLMRRLALNHLQQLADPNFDKKIARKEKKMRQDYGNKYWWRPGK